MIVLIFIPVAAVLVLGTLLQSFLFGLGVVAVMDILLILYFIRKYETRNSIINMNKDYMGEKIR